MCGEHPLVTSSASPSAGSSPHVRGALNVQESATRGVGIIPACAGSTPCGTVRSARCRDHPRMCGEHPAWLLFLSPMMGSSPHVRGALPRVPGTGRRRGIIPACAGSTGRCECLKTEEWDHPRMCGEHSPVPQSNSSASGSSPHVRGAHDAARTCGRSRGIIPACAGSTEK